MTRFISARFAAKIMATGSFVAAFLIVFGRALPVHAVPPGDRTNYASPEEALHAVKDAAASGDKQALKKIFGPEVERIASGDPVQDASDLQAFHRRLDKAAKLVRENDAKVILHVGSEGFPFPVPIVRQNAVWFFDTQEGVEEILDRRVGENELNAIRVCRGYVAAQYEYFGLDRDADGVLEYAQRLASTPGKQDGLYWQSSTEEPVSPLGPLVADAQAEGYGGTGARSGTGSQPYHGYIYKLLNRQGKDAPGGGFSYVINGNMIAGFALVAYPAEWSKSGVMTFLVNSNGNVYQKDLGDDTRETASAMDAYNPDATWTLVTD